MGREEKTGMDRGSNMDGGFSSCESRFIKSIVNNGKEQGGKKGQDNFIYL